MLVATDTRRDLIETVSQDLKGFSGYLKTSRPKGGRPNGRRATQDPNSGRVSGHRRSGAPRLRYRLADDVSGRCRRSEIELDACSRHAGHT